MSRRVVVRAEKDKRRKDPKTGESSKSAHLLDRLPDYVPREVDDLLPDEPGEVRGRALVADEPDVLGRDLLALRLAGLAREVQVEHRAHALRLVEVPVRRRRDLLGVQEREPDALAVVRALAYI